MKTTLALLGVASGTMLAACAGTGASPSSLGASARPMLQNVEWKIEDIGGKGVVDDSHATLRFGSDGRVSGRATCNRLGASYRVDGDKMTIEQPVTTLMACPPALMDQEGRLIDLLKAVRTYRIDETGALILETASGERIVARR